MGQKIHPSGFRVGITKKHQSQWFARFHKHKYSQTILEDRMIRETLNKIFPELLNPMLKGDKKQDQNSKVRKSRITQIKIERNIVPYQIGIQIHAENCKLLKSVLKNLEVKRDLIIKLQKTRQYMTNLKTKLDNLTNQSSLARPLGGPEGAGTSLPEGVTRFENSRNFSQKNLTSSTKLAQIKLLRKKLARLKNSTVKISRKETPNNKFTKLKKSISSFDHNEMSKLLKIKLLKSKLSKLLAEPKTKRKILKKGEILNKNLLTTLVAKQEELLGQKVNGSSHVDKKKKKKISGFLKKNPMLTKRELKRQRIFKKRLRLRKFIRLRDKFLISKGLYIKKIGTKIEKKLSFSLLPKFLKDLSLNSKNYLLPVKKIDKFFGKKKIKNISHKISNLTLPSVSKKSELDLKTNIYSSKMKRKFANLYVEQMKKKFLPHLNELFIKYTSEEQNSNFLKLGFLKKWNFEMQLDMLKKQPIEKLNRLVKNLREQFLKKLTLLRNEFVTFGYFSTKSSEIIGIFQLFNFLTKLKEFVNDLKRNFKHKIKTQIAVSKINGLNSLYPKGSPSLAFSPADGTGTVFDKNKLKIVNSSNNLLPQKVFRKKLELISNECEKLKFIEFLKDRVKKHRTDNIYLYLASLSESSRKLKEIKNEVKENLDFYFPGANSIKNQIKKTDSSSEKEQKFDATSQLNSHVNEILTKLSKKHVFDKTFQDSKLEELERRKNMWVKNLQFSPKISIKFFSVNPKSLEQKASVVSEAVVDALEKLYFVELPQ